MDKLSGLLGLCRKSGNLAYGNDAVVSAIDMGKAKLVLLTRDAGSNVADRISSICEPHIIDLTSEDMGNAIGRPNTAVVAVLCKNFAKAILKLIK